MMETKNLSASSQFKPAQIFGTNQSAQVEDQDIITSLKYDPTGQFLSLGDRAGRVIIFRASQPSKILSRQAEHYHYYAQFQSHVRQFDPLKGCQFSQQIIYISWLRPQGKYIKLLTTNEKSIKVWKACQRRDKKILKSANKELSMPKIQSQDSYFSVNQQYVFPSAHSHQINSLSHSKNQQYVLSTDEQNSFFWSLQKPNRPYIVNSIAAKRKLTTNELSITCSKMHPNSDSIFAFGMNRCQLGLCDIRTQSSKGKILSFGAQSRQVKNFFTDLVASVGSIQFCQNGKYIASRQYLNIKVWDITYTKKPVLNICVDESLKSKLVSLFESQSIYDKFSVASCSNGNTVLTGNYNNFFHLISMQDGKNYQYQLNFEKKTVKKQILKGKYAPLPNIDTRKKTSALAFHPNKQELVVASMNSFFVYKI